MSGKRFVVRVHLAGHSAASTWVGSYASRVAAVRAARRAEGYGRVARVTEVSS